MIRIFGFLVLSGLCGIQAQVETGAASWTWSDQNWGQFGGEYERCNLGRQSPIELLSSGNNLVQHGSVSGPIYFHNFADDTPGTFTNDGHNLIFEPDETDMYIEKGTLPDLATNFKYETIRATLHWGANDTVGSNHVIDGNRYAAEMVLHQRNRYFEPFIASLSPGTPPEEFALRYYHGYMGISLLFETKPHAYNYAFEPILEAAEALAAEGSSGTVRGSINVRDLMKSIGTTSPELFDYYAYRGSRMTPSPKEWPCSQAYGYIVPSATITIGKCQLNALRKLKFSNGEPMVDNFRNLQTQVPPEGSGKYNYFTAAELESASASD